MIEKEFTRQAPMVLTEEQRWCLQRDSEGRMAWDETQRWALQEDRRGRRRSMSSLVRGAIDVRYGLHEGHFLAGDERFDQMIADPLEPITK